MKLIISKILRMCKKDQMPYSCYASQHLPFSLHDKCDCKNFCKFPPRGNALLSSQFNMQSQSVIPFYCSSTPNLNTIEYSKKKLIIINYN